jgi:hypothetical protein
VLPLSDIRLKPQVHMTSTDPVRISQKSV